MAHIRQSRPDSGLGFQVEVGMAHIRQSRPDSGFGFQVKVLKTFRGVPSLLGSGGEATWWPRRRADPGLYV